MNDRTKDQRVYPTRTADRCSDCPPAGYPTEKTRCYGCPLTNTYKDATGELVIPTAAPSSNQRVLQGALARLIDGVRSVNIDRREWYTHIAQPLQDAYQALGGPTGLGMTAEEIARLRDESPVETTAKHQGWCASINPDPCNCGIATKGASAWCPHYDLPIVNQPGCPDCAHEKTTGQWDPRAAAVKQDPHCATCKCFSEEPTEDRRPTGQCSWGCYYASNGRLVRDSACTVHGASSENGNGDAT